MREVPPEVRKYHRALLHCTLDPLLAVDASPQSGHNVVKGLFTFQTWGRLLSSFSISNAAFRP